MFSSLFIPTLLSGALNGGIYALLALGIVLIFRTSSVANFAQGEMAMFSVFLMVIYLLPLDLPLWSAWIFTLLASGAIGALVYLAIIRPKPEAGHLNLTVRTLGLFTLVNSVAIYLWGINEPYRVPSIFGAGTVSIGGYAISYDQVGAVGVMAVVALIFLVIFRYTRLGLNMRACAINHEVASLLGVNVRQIMVSVWIIAAVIGAVAGLLIAPVSFLQTDLMRAFIFKAFTAAVLGGLQSFAGAIFGGLILGVSEAFAASLISIHMREPFVFAVLITVLLLRPAGLFGSKIRVRV